MNILDIIPDQFFDTHIHSPILKVNKSVDISEWKTGSMLTGFFFDKGLIIKNLDQIYPTSKKLFAFSLPIPYGPSSPQDINQIITSQHVKVPRLYSVLRGDINLSDINILEDQIKTNREKIIGLKFYQSYKMSDTLSFLKKSLYKQIIEISNRLKLTLFIHTNNPSLEAIKYLERILNENKYIKIVLTHAGTNLQDYNSFDFQNKNDFNQNVLNENNLLKYDDQIKEYEKKAYIIAGTPRMFVNTALLSNEITLYPIIKHLCPLKKVIWGSDLPYAYASRLVSERLPYNQTYPLMTNLYNGDIISNQNIQYKNLIFLLERFINTIKFCHKTNLENITKDIFWNIPQKLI